MNDFETVVANYAKPGGDFEELARLASERGMTHVVITQDLPLAKWQDDYPTDPPGAPLRDGAGSAAPEAESGDAAGGTGPDRRGDAPDRPDPHGDVPARFRYDPYPSWFVHRLGLLKVAPPEPVRPHVSESWAAEVMGTLEERCEILREQGLKAAYDTTEPQVLPESLFEEHPRWRGPRVDQPNRAREPHFAPCVDVPAVRELYREAVAELLERCPEIDLFRFKTTDAGSGFCWTEGLYPGENGNAACRDRSMADRVGGFFDALAAGAAAADTAVECNLVEIPPQEWMLPTFHDPEGIARELDAGQAINNFEGPDAAPFGTGAGTSDWAGTVLYPVTGIPQPVGWVRSLQEAAAAPSGADATRPPRLTYHVPPGCEELALDLYERVAADAPRNRAEALDTLAALAADRVGEAHADTLLSLWVAVDDAVTAGETIPSHPPQRIGGVHQRWLTRPFVPFPGELDAEEKAYYRPYLFQARSERHAEDLVDCQAMRPYKGWGARLLMTFVFDRVESNLRRAAELAERLAADLDGEAAAEHADLHRRLRVALRVADNSRNAIDYQAIRDHVRERGVEPDESPALGAKSGWEREFMLDRARREIDNTLALLDLLTETDDDVLDCADATDQTDIRLLEPKAELLDHLRRKVAIMNDHWTDYRRLFTQPNP